MNPQDKPSFVTPEFRTVAEVATILRLSRVKIYQLIRQHQVQVLKVGRASRIPVSEVARLKAELWQKPRRAA